MARIRSLKPEFWADEDLAELPRDARLLYMGLWNLADEHGRLRGDARYVKGQLLPYDDDLPPSAVDGLLNLLHRTGKALRYRANGRPYVYLPTLARHQRLEPDKVPSRLPAPPADFSAYDPDGGAESSESRADESAPGDDSSALLYGAWSMEQGGVRSRTPPAPRADESAQPSPFCATHQPDGTDEKCGACGRARKRAEAWERERAERERAEREAIERAPRCRVCTHSVLSAYHLKNCDEGAAP